MIERYTRPEIGNLWTLENKFKKWLDIEIYACEAWSELGHIPKEDVDLIREKADFTVERILEIESETHHDVVAFTRCVSEYLGEEKKWVHYGLTSTDVVDMALSAIIAQATDIILDDLDVLKEEIKEKALEYKDTVMMGRTHGVHAELTTLGLKFALWYAEIERNIKRIKTAREEIAYGKMSGAVGTFANIPPFVEEYVCKKMGLKPAPIATQTLQRDRHAQLMTALAILGGSLEKFATEIRGLQKTETRELEEPFRKNQKGSSAMPHKRNPIRCERITGMARVIRGYANASIEDIALWHERDISHSSVERIIIPDATALIDYMLNLFIKIVKDINVYPENMRKNIEISQGLTSSQRVLLSLIDKGLSREEAYDLVQKNAMQAWEEKINFMKLLLADDSIMEHLTKDEIEGLFDDSYHLKNVDVIFKRVGIL
ncbi:MAG: adenylosuccinate lyase [Clostridia bacterium]